MPQQAPRLREHVRPGRETPALSLALPFRADKTSPGPPEAPFLHGSVCRYCDSGTYWTHGNTPLKARSRRPPCRGCLAIWPRGVKPPAILQGAHSVPGEPLLQRAHMEQPQWDRLGGCRQQPEQPPAKLHSHLLRHTEAGQMFSQHREPLGGQRGSHHVRIQHQAEISCLIPSRMLTFFPV